MSTRPWSSTATAVAPLCAPRDLAEAQSNLDFSKIELSEGYPRRAAEHLTIAYDHAVKALEISTPCGGVDTDKDTIADIVDRCPKEPEDFDGDNDEDGCRDIDKYGDEDGDGIVNIEDGCVDQPEDFDIRRPNANRHISFGKGIHYCLGSNLAKQETRVVLELLTQKVPSLRLVEDQDFVTFPNITFRGPEQLRVAWDA